MLRTVLLSGGIYDVICGEKELKPGGVTARGMIAVAEKDATR